MKRLGLASLLGWMVGALVVASLVVAPSAFAQTSTDLFWSGQAQCQLTMQDAGYNHQETQTWTIAPGAPTGQGTMQVYPGTWSVSGQGATQKTLGLQASAGQWKTAVPPTSGAIAALIRASDNRLIIKPWHSQLYVGGAISVVKQLSVGGARPTQTTSTLASFEWPFPAVEGAADSTNLSGSGTTVIAGTYLPLQAPGTNGTATCTWQFMKGAPAASTGQLLPKIQPTVPVLIPLGKNPPPPPPPPPPPQPTATLDMSPSTAVAGSQNLSVTLTGTLTNFVQGQTSLQIGPPGVFTGISLVSLTVNSPTSATAVINIDPYGATSPIDFTVSTGAETAQTPFVTTTSSSTTYSKSVVVLVTPSQFQQGQSAAITVVGSGTHFLNGVTRMQVVGGSAALTVTSPTSATGTLSLSDFAQTGNLAYNVDTGAESGHTTPLTITPKPDAYGHSPTQASYLWLDMNTPKVISGNLLSLTGEDWFQLDGGGTLLTIDVQSANAPSSQFLADVSGTGGGAPVVSYNGKTMTQKVSISSWALVNLRIHASAWDLMYPNYTVTLTLN